MIRDLCLIGPLLRAGDALEEPIYSTATGSKIARAKHEAAGQVMTIPSPSEPRTFPDPASPRSISRPSNAVLF